MIYRFLGRFLNKLLGPIGIEIKKKQNATQEVSFKSLDSARFNDFRAAAIAHSRPTDSIVIIGAHDLVSFDSVSDYLLDCKSQVICFEPRATSFELLSKNIANKSLSKCIAVNKAIHPSLRRCIIYQISPEHISSYPSWAKGVASFSEAHMLRSAVEEHIITEMVECSNPDNWTSDYGIESISYLQIDTEGYDWEILKSINIVAFRPAVIMLEYVNLADNEKAECHTYLQEHGYDLLFNGEDIIAIDISRLIRGDESCA